MNTITQQNSIGADLLVPLAQLIRSPLNVRDSHLSENELDELGASILAHGLIQNLVVHEMPKRGKHSRYGVCAGGNRLDALNRLAKLGKVDRTYSVRCCLTDSAKALRISLSENIHRRDLHPVEQYFAFQRLIDAGESIDDVAAAFGMSTHMVMRRLTLAKVSPALLSQCRAGAIKVSQLQALALLPTHEEQETVWASAPSYRRTAENLRASIVQQKIDASTHPLALFVGVDAYRAAGGKLEGDLFSDHANAGFILDAELLDSLARERFVSTVDALTQEGWGWVTATTVIDGVNVHQYRRAAFTTRQPTSEESQRLTALADQQTALLEKIETEGLDEWDDQFQEQFDDIECERHAINDLRKTYSAKIKASAGAVVFVDSEGELQTVVGLIRAEDMNAANNAVVSDGEGAPKPLKKSGPSETLCRRLSAHRTVALQAALVAKPNVALALVAARLAAPVFFAGEFGIAPLINISTTQTRLDGYADDLDANLSHTALKEHYKAWAAHLPKKSKALMPWLLEQSPEEINRLIAFCTAHTLNAVQMNDTTQLNIDVLVSLLDVDMADHWKPTPASYLNHVPKSAIIDAVREAISAKATQPLLNLKKDALIAEADKLLMPTRWLPRILRTKQKK
jgi:ParB family transcriptional regulator, chromosome partitioning protein